MRQYFRVPLFLALLLATTDMASAMGAERADAAQDSAQQEGAWAELGFDLAEYRFDNGNDGVLIDGDASYGDDRDRIVLKVAAGGSVGRRIDEIEAQLLYSRAIGSSFVVLAGIRHEFRPHPHITYGVLGIEGEPAAGLEIESMLFLSEKGDLLGELKAVYDFEMAPAVVLQPRIQLGLAAQAIPEQGLGSGITDTEAGLRLRYALAESFAPYVGVSYERLLGETADIARAAGETVSATQFVVGFAATF